jgi:tetratricopeptide (TPR) repeat protein
MEAHMDQSTRKNELFTNAMTNLMQNKFGVSIDLLNEILNTDPDDKLALLARGSVYLKMSHAEDAIKDFSEALKLDPNHPKGYHLRGLAREILGDDEAALKDFTKAIEIDPEYGAAYYSRATLLTKMGQEDPAAEDMKMVTHLSNLNIENFANENNVWRSRQLQVESALESELHR